LAVPTLAVQLDLIRGFYAPLLPARYENAPARERDLDQLIQIAGRYKSRSNFITDLTIDPPNATSDLAQPPFLEEDYLVLSTMHSAKGCEWDVVHILHAADGMIPSDMAVTDKSGVEEERRLLYVAMTRARDRLYVYFPLRYYRARRRGDAHTYAQLSRYLTKDVVALFEQRTGHSRLESVDEPRRRGTPIADPRASVRRLWGC
jgi:DNA helicase-2/ATP-dependent DNA helicase PcrA